MCSTLAGIETVIRELLDDEVARVVAAPTALHHGLTFVTRNTNDIRPTAVRC